MKDSSQNSKNIFRNNSAKAESCSNLHNQILWLPVGFALGIIFYFWQLENDISKIIQDSNQPLFYLAPALLLLSAFFLFFIHKNPILRFLLGAAAVFLCGFLWAKFYTKNIAQTPIIKVKTYGTAVGKINDINSYYNPILKRNSYQIILQDLAIYKAGALKDDVIYKSNFKVDKIKNKAKKSKKHLNSKSGKKKAKKTKRKAKKENFEAKNQDQEVKEEITEQNTIETKENIAVDENKNLKKKRKSRKKPQQINQSQNQEIDQENLKELAKENELESNKQELPKQSSKENDLSASNENPISNSLNQSEIEVKQKKPRKPRKPRKKPKQFSEINSQNQEQVQNSEVETSQEQLTDQNQATSNPKPKKPRKTKTKKNKPKKIKTPKPKKNQTIIKNYLNVQGYQEIDRQFLTIDYKNQQQKWLNNQLISPPKKIIINVNTKLNGAKIGDIIQSRVLLEPAQKAYFPGGYDRNFFNYFAGIGASGYSASDIKILKIKDNSFFGQEVKILRQKIAKKILDQSDSEKFYGQKFTNQKIEDLLNQSSGIAVALLVGSQNFIPAAVMTDIRNSGLAHLLSISGLHFTLAAGIFFFSLRFLLSLSSYLVLHYDIKKIAAFLAILTSFGYLLLADMPVPAIRSFIVTGLIFTAILLDLKPDSFRSTAFGALAILIFSPEAVFSVSFQLSFAAILSLIVLADITAKYHINSNQRPLYLKFFLYFLGIILSSIFATIATTVFSIYHFNNFISYGFLANLLAIPIASFLTMPLGFLALCLMPFGLEHLPLILMKISISWIVKIAALIASLPNSYFAVKSISTSSFALIILGGLWLALWRKNLRFWGFLPIIFGLFLAYQTPIPKVIIDGDRKILAFYYNQQLIFLKPSRSRQTLAWAHKVGLKQFKTIEDLSDTEKQNLQFKSYKNYDSNFISKTNKATKSTERKKPSPDFYQFNLNNKKILVISGRNQIAKICQENQQNNYDLVVNLSRKYQLPKCFKESNYAGREILDNQDLQNRIIVKKW